MLPFALRKNAPTKYFRGVRGGFRLAVSPLNVIDLVDASSLSLGRARASSDFLGLLVSVTTLEEAALAAGQGVAVVDIKDPGKGALGGADPVLWDQVASRLPAKVRLSAALGEAIESTSAERLPSRFQFAKAGPGGSGNLAALVRRWSKIRKSLPAATEFVGVAYADFVSANAPSPEEVFQAAVSEGLRWVLVDTFTKDGRSTCEHLGRDRLQALDDLAAGAGVSYVLAGSLKLNSLPSLVGLRHRLIGLRGAVCDHGRTGQLSQAKIQQWQTAIESIRTKGHDASI
ncbi:hypothetical protein FF011L_10800 [Roseimaritima multifibrata]|uniref:(5-formylfuran-3-yl)methyl phosphate synthase n=1 Tax=Roseimaritima multifibrata TaxID=1930274 RepID=A0A517MBS1_9BACT|nr:hypothetical protein FF011L_10800 [Roseimaritima multifibrata]